MWEGAGILGGEAVERSTEHSAVQRVGNG